ncbi:MAG: type II toxin-antitoxin system VapC family toxin [Terriglobales bacterium]
MGRFRVILVDTHVVLWLAFEPTKISKKARAAIKKAREDAEGLAICDITLLEITNLERKRRISLCGTLETFLTEIEIRFIVLPITARVCVRATSLPAAYPNDPADRVIGATALVEGIPLISADAGIRGSSAVPIIW